MPRCWVKPTLNKVWHPHITRYCGHEQLSSFFVGLCVCEYTAHKRVCLNVFSSMFFLSLYILTRVCAYTASIQLTRGCCVNAILCFPSLRTSWHSCVHMCFSTWTMGILSHGAASVRPCHDIRIDMMRHYTFPYSLLCAPPMRGAMPVSPILEAVFSRSALLYRPIDCHPWTDYEETQLQSQWRQSVQDQPCHIDPSKTSFGLNIKRLHCNHIGDHCNLQVLINSKVTNTEHAKENINVRVAVYSYCVSVFRSNFGDYLLQFVGLSPNGKNENSWQRNRWSWNISHPSVFIWVSHISRSGVLTFNQNTNSME